MRAQCSLFRIFFLFHCCSFIEINGWSYNQAIIHKVFHKRISQNQTPSVCTDVDARLWFYVIQFALHWEYIPPVLLGEWQIRKIIEMLSRDNHLFSSPNCSNHSLGSHESLRKATTDIHLHLHTTTNLKQCLARMVSLLFFILFLSACLKQ